MTARIVTPWFATGDDRGNYPQLLIDHLPVGVCFCQDVTGQPAPNLLPSPNLYTVEISGPGVTAAWLTTVAADNTYQILWSE